MRSTLRWQLGDGGELSDAAAGREWSQAGWFARKAVWCGGGLADILALWRQCREVARGGCRGEESLAGGRWEARAGVADLRLRCVIEIRC